MNILSAINIQYPFSKMIIEQLKVIETRTYDIPKDMLNTPLFLVETPGTENFRARVIGIIIFKDSFKYVSIDQFRADYKRHLVLPNSIWDWRDKPKWGWEVEVLEKFEKPKKILCNKGITFTKNLEVEN